MSSPSQIRTAVRGNAFPDRLRSGMRPPAPQAGAFAPTSVDRIPLFRFEVSLSRSAKEVTS